MQNPEGGINLPWLSSYTNPKSPQRSGWLIKISMVHHMIHRLAPEALEYPFAYAKDKAA
jgi:hypothetical protein